MLKFLFLLLIYICFGIKPIFAQNQKLYVNSSLTFYSKKFLDLQDDLGPSDKGIATFDIKFDSPKPQFQLAVNYNGSNNFNFDRSYIHYTSGIATFGIGAVDYHWSFSDKTSLILSHNARPTKSIYLKLNNKISFDKFPSKAGWSFEIFNGLTEGSLNNKKSMLMGARAILSPIEGLDFEILQTSQWGGDGYDNRISAIGAALLANTNDSPNANINKMAGFGISYILPSDLMQLRIYGQAIGEDEAGSLPSCYAYLAGLEWSKITLKYPTSLGIEAIDTRIKRTSHGNCGPNTMYNNHIYNYTNYGKTMGAAIDTEGYSLEIFGQSQLHKKLNIKYSTKKTIINDKNWTGHRLSSNRQSGFISSLGITWAQNSLNFSANIYYQDFILNKANINEDIGVGFSSSMVF
jgi:hypothetical protein